MRVSVGWAGLVTEIKKASKSEKKKKSRQNLENSPDFAFFFSKNCWDLAGSPRI